MSASAAERGLFRIPLANAAFRQTEGGEDVAPEYGSNARAQRVRDVLRQSGYTVRELSTGTGARYGFRSPYFIPPTFLHKLRRGVTPHLCQIVGLSESTGYRFVDWMRMFGFDLHQIPRLQAQLHPERTVLITPIEFETASFRSPLSGSDSSAIHQSAWRSALRSPPGENSGPPTGRYLVAKIGSRDALVSRKLIAGMIVRVDRCYRRPQDGAGDSPLQNLLWLVERPGGLSCCHVKWMEDNQVVLLPSRPPFGSLPLRLPTEARILGLVDLEQSSVKPGSARPRAGPVEVDQSLATPLGQTEMRFSDLLRAARCRTGLTFRAAHQLTGALAQILASRDYAVGLGLLSDYEAMGRLPRHIAKIISLCITYCLDIRQLMEAAGVYIDDSNKMPLPVVDPLLASGTDFLDRAEHCRTIGLGAG